MFPRLGRAAPEPKPFKIDPGKPLTPRSFRAEGPIVYPPPDTVFKYRPPSLLRRHALLALVFLLICALAVWGLVSAFHHPRPPAASDPVYVEPLHPQ